MSSESSAAVQREAESERAELVSTLDQLRENLRPENVVDEVMASARITTADLTDKVWKTARNNPIPSVLIGLGAAMLMGGVGSRTSKAAPPADRWPAEGSGTRRTEVPRDPSPGQPARAEPKLSGSTLASLSRATDKARRQLVSQLRVVGSKAAASTAQITNSAQALRRQAGASATSARDGLTSTSGDTAMAQYNRSRDQIVGSVTRLLDEQPLVLAALGIAVGAAIGAAIPGTEAEGRLMGDASASVRNRAQDFAQQEYGHLKETVSATVDNLKQNAVDHGVSSENLTGLIRDTGDTVKSAAADLADHAAGTGNRT